MLIVFALSAGTALADEQRPVVLELKPGKPSAAPMISVSDLAFQFAERSRELHQFRIDLPKHPRVSRSHRPLRQVSLIGGDRLIGECLDWGTQAVTIRLQDDQVVNVPVAAIARMANSPGEWDLLVESFEIGLSATVDSDLGRMLDETRSAWGRSSLRVDSSTLGFRKVIDPPLESARIEFSFQTATHDDSTACGEWKMEWDHPDQENNSLVIRVNSDRTIAVTESLKDSDSTLQTWKLAEGWHTFIALITPDRVRLIVDEAILASCSAPKAAFKAIHFRPVNNTSANLLWVDELQIRKMGNPVNNGVALNEEIARDRVTTESGDELFGRIIGVTENAATLECLGKARSIPLSRMTSLDWSQPSSVIRQTATSGIGVVARITLQSFVDRPACEAEELTGTISAIDAKHLFLRHALMGEIKLRWSDVLRVDPLFFGQSFLIDARRFHLGNSIRTDFHRPLPDGTQFRGEFVLIEIPAGDPSFSLDVAELEAAGPAAPRASPFLAELRAGQLVTEVFINDQSLGNLNQQLRFKPTVQHPERIRLKIPRALLKRGQNLFQLRQQPLKRGGREFDDGEVGNLRIDFEQ